MGDRPFRGGLTLPFVMSEGPICISVRGVKAQRGESLDEPRVAYVSSDNPKPSEWPSIDRLAFSTMKLPVGPPIECPFPTCRTGGLHVSPELIGPGYLIDPIPSGYETVGQPRGRAGHDFPNCGLRQPYS